MTSKQRNQIVERFAEQYQDIGALIVGDDESLCRLLGTLKIGVSDRELGDYLCSFLIA
jgi:chemotaxis methyl-accepting protein methylase